MTFQSLASQAVLESEIQRAQAALVWFSGPDCGVCAQLKPRVAELIAQHYPEIRLFEVDCSSNPQLAAQQQVFVVPTLKIYFEGTEFLHKSRNFSLGELRGEIDRPYRLLFG